MCSKVVRSPPGASRYVLTDGGEAKVKKLKVDYSVASETNDGKLAQKIEES